MTYKTLPIAEIKPDKNQPRQNINHTQRERIKGMAQNIQTEGIINAIEIDEDNIIVTGEMRWRAAQLAGLKEVPCKVVKNITAYDRFRRQVAENIHHNTMGDIDTAKALKKLLRSPSDHKGKGHWNDQGIRTLAKELGVSHQYILEKLDLLIAPKEVQNALNRGDISFTHARELSKTPEQFKSKLQQKILNGEFNRSNSVSEVISALNRNPEKSKEILAIDYKPLKSTAEVIEKVTRVSPRLSDIVAAKLKPRQELTKIKDSLLDWLRQNHPHDMMLLDRGQIILTLSLMVDKINEWGITAQKKG